VNRRTGKLWVGMVVALLAVPVAAGAAKPRPVELEEVTREAGL